MLLNFCINILNILLFEVLFFLLLFCEFLNGLLYLFDILVYLYLYMLVLLVEIVVRCCFLLCVVVE